MIAWKFITSLFYPEQFDRISYQCSLKLASNRSVHKIQKYLSLINAQEKEIMELIEKDENEQVIKLKVQKLFELERKKNLTEALIPHYEILLLYSENNNEVVDKNKKIPLPGQIAISVYSIIHAYPSIEIDELKNIIKQLKLLYSDQIIDTANVNYDILDDNIKKYLNVVYDPVQIEKDIYSYLSSKSKKYLEKYKSLHLYPVELENNFNNNEIDYHPSPYQPFEPSAPPLNPEEE